MGKGADFERDIAKFLTLWLTGQKKEYYFWRSPGSGSIATVTMTNPGLNGDIIPLKNEAKFLLNNCVIECKNGYPRASIDKHLKGNKNDQLLDFWAQVDNDATKTDKYPILIYRKKGFNYWIGINSDFNTLFFKYLIDLKHIAIHWTVSIDDMYIYDMNEFFNNITPDIMKRSF